MSETWGDAGKVSEPEYTSAETTVRREGREEKRNEEDISEQTDGGLMDKETEFACRVTEQNGGASTAYLVTDESCGARVRGRHFCAAGALFSPIASKKKRKGRTLLPQPVITGGRERVALSLSASQLMLLHCLSSHFLYKIDALTAALVCTRPHIVTV